jgi:hypothetical protein
MWVSKSTHAAAAVSVHRSFAPRILVGGLRHQHKEARMFCPKCKSEFEPGYAECARCGVALVEELPSPPQPEYEDLKTVLVAPDETVLMVAISRLEAAGIPCFTTNNMQDLFGLGRIAGYNLVIGPQELQVPPEEWERAVEILNDVLNTEEEDGQET